MTALISINARSTSIYKPFVDGLRAVSIVAVVGYHANIPGVWSGFIGVDVFFVISGYLIIGQIATNLSNQSFSISEFWARRALRILPAYLLVISASIVIAAFVLVIPQEFVEFGREVQYSSLMVVNYYFLASAGYFETASELKPLLHLWSLSVEEQFYLAAPLVLLGAWWIGRRRGRPRVIVLSIAVLGAVLSFAFCVMMTGGDNPAFFLMPYRAWEFALGGAIPLVVPRLRRLLPDIAIELLAFAGLAMIVAAAICLGEVPYPSYFALLPVLGACLVISAGLAHPHNSVARLLAAAPLVWVGLVSYAWYLWHWPLLSFSRINNFGEDLAPWTWGAVAVSLALAALTYHFLEVPIRRWRAAGRLGLGWNTVAIGAGAAVLVSAVGASYVHLVAPTIARSLKDNALWAEADWSIADDPCGFKPKKRKVASCFKKNGDRPYGVLAGNSHARMIYAAVDKGAEESDVEIVGLVRVACIPYLPIGSLRQIGLKENCSSFYANGAAQIRDLQRPPEFAILSARWNNKKSFDLPLGSRSAKVLEEAGLSLPAPADLRLAMAVGLGAFLAEIETWHAKRTLVVGPVPEFGRPIPECLARAENKGLGRDYCAVPREQVERRRKATMATLDYLADNFPTVRIIDPIDIFCDEETCRPYDERGPFYTDGDHLSIHGAEVLYAAFRADFDWAIKGGE